MSTPIDPPLSRRAARQAEQSALDAQAEVFAQPATRRGLGGTPVSVPSAAPSDIAYRTQVRPRVPHYDAPPPTPPVISSPAADAPAERMPHASLAPVAPPAAPPLAPLAPPAAEGLARRRDFRPPAEQVSAQQAPLPSGSAAYDTELEYHTLRSPRRDAAPPASPVVSAPPVAAAAPPVEQTLSRRELRALREQAGIAVEPVAQPAPVESVPVPSVPPQSVPVESVPVESVGIESAPTGSHWSDGIHAEDDPFENTFSREVGSASSLTSTNALVLPEMPSASIAGPVTGTGEIIITGMIDLPRTVSSTGAVPTVHESPDIDDLLDPGEVAVAPPDSAPVSAARAVSSHTQAQTIIPPATSRVSSNAVTTALVASTVVMAVVAIGLFVVAAVNGLF